MTIINEHRWQDCQESDCAACQANVDDGYVISCDECCQPGSADSDGWVLGKDQLIYCCQCAVKLDVDSA